MAVGITSSQVRTIRGAADALLFSPDGEGPFPAIIVWSDLTGLRPAIAAIGHRLAELGYVVLAPNAFYRSVALDGSEAKAAQRLDFGETMRRGAPWRAAASDAEIILDTMSYIAFLDAHPQVAQHTPIGMLGVDIGAAHSFIAARAKPQRVKAVAAVHPLSIASPRDTSPHLFVNRSKANYLVEIAAPDDAREPEDKGDLRDAFANAGLGGQVNIVDAAHGYLVEDDPAYDADAARLSWARVISHFNENLR